MHGTWDRFLLFGGLLEPSKGGTGMPGRPGGCCCCCGWGTEFGPEGTVIPPLVGIVVVADRRPVEERFRAPLTARVLPCSEAAAGAPCTEPSWSDVSVNGGGGWDVVWGCCWSGWAEGTGGNGANASIDSTLNFYRVNAKAVPLLCYSGRESCK